MKLVISRLSANSFAYLDLSLWPWPKQLCLFIDFKTPKSVIWQIQNAQRIVIFITVFTVFRLLTDFVCLYNYEFWLSLCKIVRSSVILLLPLFIDLVWRDCNLIFKTMKAMVKSEALVTRNYPLPPPPPPHLHLFLNLTLFVSSFCLYFVDTCSPWDSITPPALPHLPC